MFHLRPDEDDSTFEDEDVEPELDATVVDRLSAYASDDDVEADEPADAAPPVAEQSVADHDRAVEEGHLALEAEVTRDEPDEPGEEDSEPGSYESHLPEHELPEPDEPAPGEPSPAVFSVSSWEHPRHEEETHQEFALPEAELSSPGLFEAELTAFDLEAEHEDETDDGTEPEAATSLDGTPEDLELGDAEQEGGESEQSPAFEASADSDPEVVEPGALVDELPEPELPAAEVEAEDGDEPELAESAAAAAGLADAALNEQPIEATSRRSFRFRRSAPSDEGQPREKKEKKGRKERAPREKRGSKDRKAKRLVGLKIGASQIAAAEVVNNGAPELVEVFREPLEPGLVVSGEIRDPEALAVALKRLFELHKLPKRGVRLGLSNNRIGVRSFEIEGVTDTQQLDNAIRFRAEEVLPIPLDEAVLDYVVLEEAVREDGTPWKRILVVVAYREVVDRYLQACRSAGIEVVGIDLEAFALLRAVEAPLDRGQHAGALVAVAIGHDRTTIAVSTGRHCEFTRVLDWGGWSLNVAIARELDKAPSEVEALKRQLSFSGPTEVEGFTPEQTAKAREAIQRSLNAFVRELVASLQFYQAQPGALGIGEVVLTGGTAHMDGLPEALGELVGVPIRLGDPFKRVKVGPKVSHDGPRGSLSVAIGLGIED